MMTEETESRKAAENEILDFIETVIDTLLEDPRVIWAECKDNMLNVETIHGPINLKLPTYKHDA